MTSPGRWPTVYARWVLRPAAAPSAWYGRCSRPAEADLLGGLLLVLTRAGGHWRRSRSPRLTTNNTPPTRCRLSTPDHSHWLARPAMLQIRPLPVRTAQHRGNTAFLNGHAQPTVQGIVPLPGPATRRAADEEWEPRGCQDATLYVKPTLLCWRSAAGR